MGNFATGYGCVKSSAADFVFSYQLVRFVDRHRSRLLLIHQLFLFAVLCGQFYKMSMSLCPFFMGTMGQGLKSKDFPDKTSMSEPNRELSDAVRSLRRALNESQEEFATRMKTSVKTITRYETVRPPTGAALAKLALIAQQAGEDYLAEVFEKHLFTEAETLGEILAVDSAREVLNALYLNQGDAWLVEQIRDFLRSARQGALIRHPLVIKGDRTALDREIQLSIWEHHLIRARLRAGQSLVNAREVFAREYAHDTGATEDQAMVYTRIKFPGLWPEESRPTEAGVGERRGADSSLRVNSDLEKEK
jgi:transcriptional regulator with XRE-family HTH domain